MYFTIDKLGQVNLEGAAVGEFMGCDPKDRQREEEGKHTHTSG